MEVREVPGEVKRKYVEVHDVTVEYAAEVPWKWVYCLWTCRGCAVEVSVVPVSRGEVSNRMSVQLSAPIPA